MRMKMKAQKCIVLKRNFKNLMSVLLPIVKKVISNQINKIKSRVTRKIRTNKIGKMALENIINTPKVATLSKIATKPKKVSKKNPNDDELKNRVIKQLKKHFKKLFDVKKSKYLDDDNVEYKGI